MISIVGLQYFLWPIRFAKLCLLGVSVGIVLLKLRATLYLVGKRELATFLGSELILISQQGFEPGLI